MLGAPLALLAACGSGGSAGSSSEAVAVTTTDDRCDVERTSLRPGATTMVVTNKGSQVTEVYVYGEDNGKYSRVIGEAENIGPGTSRDLKVTLTSGTYEVACKPGQSGNGIRTRVTVAR
jgi:uncharacterized cupredoxin-like copper-binding protein